MRFCEQVLGVAGLDPSSIQAVATGLDGTTDPPRNPERAVVVGISGSGDVRHVKTDWVWGEGRPDALIWDRDTLVLVEVKLPLGKPLERRQLLRHASFGRLAIDWDSVAVDADDLPAGIGSVSWSVFDEWLVQEPGLARAGRAVLDLRGATAAATSFRPSEPVRRLAIPVPIKPSEINSIWDVAIVRRQCSARYAGELVTADRCVEDTHRMLAAYAATATPAPPGLRFASPKGGAMTPERVLSSVFTGRPLPNAVPKTLAAFRDRTLLAGFDRPALVGLWSWATDSSTGHTAAAKRICEFVPHVWPEAPDAAPGLEDLHSVLASARR